MRSATSFGFSRESCSQPRFHFSSAPGRKFSTAICEPRARRRTISCPSGRRRLHVTDFLFRDCTCHQREVPLRMRRHLRSASPSPGGSILITSAPKSASVLAQNGPAIRLPSSSTRTPLKGPVMNKPVNVLLSIIGVVAALPALAQSPDVPDHPALRDKFYLGAGVFLPKTSTSAQLNSSTLGIGTNIDFERTLGFEDSKSVPAFFGRWRFGERWRLEAEYFELNRSGTRTLSRDIQWGDRVFAANSQL